jgi:hypothetical protein
MKKLDNAPVLSKQEAHDRRKNGKTDNNDIGFYEEAVNSSEERISDSTD